MGIAHWNNGGGAQATNKIGARRKKFCRGVSPALDLGHLLSANELLLLYHFELCKSCVIPMQRGGISMQKPSLQKFINILAIKKGALPRLF